MTETPQRPPDKPIEAVLFDLGETLLNYGRVEMNLAFYRGVRGAHAHLAQQGRAPRAFWRYFAYLFVAIRWKYVKSLFTGREFDTLEMIADLHRTMHVDLSRDDAAELAWRLYYPLSRAAEVDPDAREVLGDLEGMGIRLGLISNTFLPGVTLDRHLREVGLLKHLPVRVYSSQTLFRKPAPEIFHVALQKIGVPAGQCLFVGDTHGADVVGAERAGMLSVLKDPSGRARQRDPKPRYRVRRLRELLEIVRASRGG